MIQVSGLYVIQDPVPPNDGKTRLYIHLDIRLAVPLYWVQTSENGVSIDWGDGSTAQTFSGTGSTSTTHNYTTGGDYCITIEVTAGTLEFGDGNGTYMTLFGTGSYMTILTNAAIGNNVTTIAYTTFCNCLNLKSITLPSGITSIEAEAFNFCCSLKSITLPSGITSIGNSIFSNCYALLSVTLPNGLTSIGTNTFPACYSLTSITIPSNVSSIGSGAFVYCEFMKEYHFQSATPPTLADANVFYMMPSDCVIYVPSASLSAYQAATYWSTYASQMVGE